MTSVNEFFKREYNLSFVHWESLSAQIAPSSGTYIYIAQLPNDGEIISAEVIIYCFSAQSISNFYTVNFYTLYGLGSSPFYSFGTAADATSSWILHESALSVAVTKTTNKFVVVRLVPSGTPGAIHVLPPIVRFRNNK